MIPSLFSPVNISAAIYSSYSPAPVLSFKVRQLGCFTCEACKISNAGTGSRTTEHDHRSNAPTQASTKIHWNLDQSSIYLSFTAFDNQPSIPGRLAAVCRGLGTSICALIAWKLPSAAAGNIPHPSDLHTLLGICKSSITVLLAFLAMRTSSDRSRIDVAFVPSPTFEMMTLHTSFVGGKTSNLQILIHYKNLETIRPANAHVGLTQVRCISVCIDNPKINIRNGPRSLTVCKMTYQSLL